MDIHHSFENALSWEELNKISPAEEDRKAGPTNSYSSIRLFGKSEEEIRVTLYRDHHAWCPYCQKVWLWLEWKQIPYKIKKVTMYCYGKKEAWYTKKVPSGILPALELDNNIITESDQILLTLEKAFGPLGLPIEHKKTLELRYLERRLFRSWCSWLCQPSLFNKQEEQRQKQFQKTAIEMEKQIDSSPGPWLDPSTFNGGKSYPGSADIIFIPYVERMNASLAYYKGFNLREEHKAIHNWLKELEKSFIYRGTQGDFHTHSHDLPPQMGGCFYKRNKKQEEFSNCIDSGKGLGESEISNNDHNSSNNTEPEYIALQRVIKHKEILKQLNIIGPELFDQPLRAALTKMIFKKPCKPNPGSAKGLRYLRDRISVPRDMPLLAARRLREALESTACIDGAEQSIPLSIRNRFDQNPEPFLK